VNKGLIRCKVSTAGMWGDVMCRGLCRSHKIDVEVNVGSVDNLMLREAFIDENLEEMLGVLKCICLLIVRFSVISLIHIIPVRK
jgi:hypothetical protein